MQIRARFLFAVGAGLLLPASATAQGTWVPHQPPCELNTGHYLLKGATLRLKMAVEARFEEERVQRLEEALDVLGEAIHEKGQAENAASWYYLGRTYAERRDFVGADSAFRRAVDLAPACLADVDGHRRRLATFALNEALRTWGAGARDSAGTFFRLAARLDTADAEIPLYASMMYASAQQTDSAAHFLELGLLAAETDTAHAERLRQALLEVARGYESRAFQEVPAILTVGQARHARDTTAERVAADSALLERIVTEVSGIRSSGGRLNPQALASFQRDSTVLETRLARARAARDSLTALAAADSATTVDALASARRYYRRYLERYPDDADVALQLLRLEAAAGDRAGLDAVVERVTASPDTRTANLVPAALSLYSDGLYPQAARLTEAALARNAYDHAALGLATHLYHTTRDADRLRTVADRRLALAPLDPSTARAMALAWDVAGRADSVQYWLAMADSGLGWHVHVTQFQSTEHSSSLSGYVRNAVQRDLPALTLTVEFLAPDGTVLFSAPLAVEAIPQGGRAQLSLRLEQGNAASWRYRRE